ncbi:12230_t:CDS:2 [Funneliformis caledonium]|uniref:12230_t:CDS:1 n=1 Tax=Funneliformis caledonium TaxID=1117310 RepID=A0A9N9GUG1_9GLOM|nr:12230_t:CDS:2 [Funneliformis caledonium]
MSKKEQKEIDETTRRKNIEIHLNELERDNYQEIPELEIVTGTISKPRRFSDLADTSQPEKPPDIPTYLTAGAKPSRFPPRKFCSVCGFISAYACKKCGMKYCSLRCKETHEETRCMKYTV